MTLSVEQPGDNSGFYLKQRRMGKAQGQ
jgi:hypothetical protein